MTTALERQIRSQPEELERILTSHQTREEVHIAAEGLHRAHRIWIVGTGTSLHAAEIGALLLAESGRGAVVLPAMRFVTMAPVIGPHDTIVVVTHTAETAYALAARSLAFEHGIDTIMITRRGAGFPHMIETVDKESAETYTVSYTATLVAFAMLAQELGAETVSADDLTRVPGAVAGAIETPGIDGIDPPDRLLVIAGAGPAATTAAEGALKAREGARLAAEGFDVEYLLHGSAVPLDGRDRLVTIGPPDEELLAAVRGAATAAGVATSDVREPADLPMLLAQIPLAVRLQVMALRMAEAGGQDPDTVIVGPWAEAGMWRIGAPQG
jgi:glucosamine--fructose-6-phosphate aminotransferase (isomerizing)